MIRSNSSRCSKPCRLASTLRADALAEGFRQVARCGLGSRHNIVRSRRRGAARLKEQIENLKSDSAGHPRERLYIQALDAIKNDIAKA